MLREGIHPKIVQERLGNSSRELLLGYYQIIISKIRILCKSSPREKFYEYCQSVANSLETTERIDTIDTFIPTFTTL